MVPGTWARYSDGNWCSFDFVSLQSIGDVGGVYVVGCLGDASILTVYVGQADDIAKRLGQHRDNPDITTFRSVGGLLATWAVVPEHARDGIERYVADQLKPLVGSHHPNATPIPVNLPQGWA